mgnify:CR=1 FL=1
MAVMELLNWLILPWQYEFMVKALGVSALVGMVCAALSCYMILKGWALMGDAVSHAVMPGVVIAYILQIPLAIGAFVFGIGSVVAIGLIQQKTRIKEDTVIGLVFTGLFALGLVLIAKIRSSLDLTHILFGNVLGIPDSELVQTLIISLITLVTLGVLGRDLVLFCFDPIHARSIGINTSRLYYVLLSLLSLTAVAGIQAVGIILVVSMLITPGATAYLLTDRFDHMTAIAIGCGVGSSLLGTYCSYYLDLPTGATIVLTQTLLFITVLVFAPKYGLISQSDQASDQADDGKLE